MNKGIGLLFDFGHVRYAYEHDNVYSLINNVVANKFTAFDEKTNQKINLPSMIHEVFDTLMLEQPVTWLLKKESFLFKIVIEYSPKEESKMTLYPMVPFKKKDQELDFSFYIQCIIELCENFAICRLIADKE